MPGVSNITAAQQLRVDSLRPNNNENSILAQQLLKTKNAPSELSKSQLAPGDILLYVKPKDSQSLTQKLIQAGQKLPNIHLLKNTGDPALTHAALWTKAPDNPGKASVEGKGEPEVVEMRGGKSMSSFSGPVREGFYKVYSPKNENLGDWAAQVGMMWGADKTIQYSVERAAKSVIKDPSFDSKAQEKAKVYEDQAFENDPSFSKDGAFCSHFVMAAYQAAAGNTETPLPDALKVNAKAMSVRALEHFLKQDPDNFYLKGTLDVKAEEVLYPT